MLRKLSLVALLIWLPPVFALGLGEMEVTSRLNQPLVGSIPISTANPGEVESLTVRIASADAFNRAGIDYADYLATLSFEIVTERGAPRVLVRSSQPAREPFLSFLLEARWQTGRLLREYTILLDPPATIAAPTRQPAAPVARPAPETSTSDYFETSEEQQSRPGESQPVLTQPSEPAAQPSMAGDSGGGTYGPVSQQETLWSIATRLRPTPAVTMDQMLIAIFEANPEAFDGGLNGLRKGSMLRVPTLDQIQSVDRGSAKSRVDQARSGGRVTRAPRREPRTQTARPTPPPEPVAVPEPEPEVVAEAPPPAPKPQAPPAAKPQTPPAPTPKPPSALSQLQELAQKPAPTPPPPAPEPEATIQPAPAVPPPPTETPAPPPATAMVDEPPTPTAEPTPGAMVEEETALAPPPEPEPAPAPAPVAPPPDKGGSFFDELPIIPIAIALGLILAGVGGYLFWRKRQEAAETEPAPVPMARPSQRLQAPDDLDVTATAAPPPQPAPKRPAPQPAPPADSTVTLRKPVAPEAPAAGMTSTMSLERAMATAQIEPAEPAGQATEAMSRLDQTMAGDDSLNEATGAPDKVDFDVTGNYAAETMSINLDANDPVSEADFHLAYGLYDEAALLLQQAVKKDPNRPDIRIKLAETYFLAGKPAEFLKASEELKPMAKLEDWQKVAIMGQQLCPDAPLFKETDGAALGGGVDLVFGEPAPGEGAAKPAEGNALDFNLEDFGMPAEKPAAAPAAAAPAKPADNVLEFDLAQFDLGTPAPSTPAPTKPTKPATSQGLPPGATATGSFDLDLKDFDLGGGRTVSPNAATLTPDTATATAVGGLEFDLGGSGGDDPGTKLDLARAYLEMGDKNEARTLLNDVVKGGSSQQKKEAQELLQRVSA